MGHHSGSKNNLVPLIDRLNKYPVGLVDSEKLRQILALLFDEKEAYIASRFPLEEATLDELSRRTRIAAAELHPILERMADKGLVMDLPYAGTTYYLLVPGLIGFFEFTFMKSRVDLPMAEVARLMEEYMHENPREGMAREFFGSPTPMTRSLAYEEYIPVSSQVTTHERAREIIREAGYGAVGLCYCRHKKEHLGRKCGKEAPVEGMCISLGNGARFLVRRGFAEERTIEELLAVLERGKELRLTHITDNIRNKPSFICNCCSCCCELLAGIHAGYREGVGRTGFCAAVDPVNCNGCGLCAAACNVDALAVGTDGVATVAREMCLGCGACVAACARKALTLEDGARPVPPASRRELYTTILKEKGRLGPWVRSGVRRKVRRLMGRKR